MASRSGLESLGPTSWIAVCSACIPIYTRHIGSSGRVLYWCPMHWCSPEAMVSCLWVHRCVRRQYIMHMVRTHPAVWLTAICLRLDRHIPSWGCCESSVRPAQGRRRLLRHYSSTVLLLWFGSNTRWGRVREDVLARRETIYESIQLSIQYLVYLLVHTSTVLASNSDSSIIAVLQQ